MTQTKPCVCVSFSLVLRLYCAPTSIDPDKQSVSDIDSATTLCGYSVRKILYGSVSKPGIEVTSSLDKAC